MIDYLNAAFISAAKTSRTAGDNAGRHAALGVDLLQYGLNAEPCQGVYQAAGEPSYIVDMPRPLLPGKHQDYLMQLARRYEQESVLATMGGSAYLLFTIPGHLYLGRIVAVDAPRAGEDHTRLADGTILVVRP